SSEAFSRVSFLASTAGQSGALHQHADNEYLWDQNIGDDFTLSALHQDSLFHRFASFLEALRPDVVHIHHVAHLGVEILQVLKNVLPGVKILYTLHEYMPICHHYGQMRRPDGTLCERSDIDLCPRCFPLMTREDFWQRKTRLQHYFALVDRFVCPSEFLRQRYVDWGLAPERLVTVENGLRPVPAVPPRPLKAGEGRCRFAFFGQFTPFKGLDFLLETLLRLPPEDLAQITLEVHGGGLESMPLAFQQRLTSLREKAEQTKAAIWRGPYRFDEVSDRMANVDYVLVPSLWWENSPVVIQEAFAVGRPVLVSAIGGMAEKVRHGVNGLHVPVGDAQAWADTLLSIATDTALYDRLCAGIVPPPTVEETTRRHLDLIRELTEN
ncbi:MAG: glycosyltransferase family 4 protein, partial [Desulfovibrio sp.]|nr:glycosyltransferase family 4 protein [Desulfovibrio sp.]